MRKIVLGIGGASGAIYARLLMEQLASYAKAELQIAVVASENARINWNLEIPDKPLESFPFKFYAKRDFNAPFASGSAQFDTMVICPCSMGLLGRIANGISDDLMSRSADVILKERRKLILVPRETPLSLIHLRNMVQVTESGGIICPAIPSFYNQPQSKEEVAMTVINRVLDLMNLDVRSFRWGGGEL